MSLNAESSLPIQDTAPVRKHHLHKGPLLIIKFIYDLFTHVTVRTPPPNPNKKIHLRLITIRPSHFCEKARWALDLLDEDEDSPYWYTEDAHPPGLHTMETVPVTNDKGSSTPVVVMGEQVWMKSNEILREFCPNLYPTEEVKKMEDDMGNRLGATLRVFAYKYILQDEYWESLKAAATADTSKIETFLFEKMRHEVKKSMIKSMNINDSTADISKEAIIKIFKEYSDILEHQEYLAGNEFTAADLTFAALSSPFLRPPELSEVSIPEELVPPPLRLFAEELKATKAGQHVLKVYSKHRNRTPGKMKVALKTANRDRTPGVMWSGIVAGIALMIGAGVSLMKRKP
jgi:glutathione S-transferase